MKDHYKPQPASVPTLVWLIALAFVLLCLILAIPARGATVTFTMTNSITGLPDTNVIIIQGVYPVVNADGSFRTVGFPARFQPNTNGFYGWTNAPAGAYIATNAFISGQYGYYGSFGTPAGVMFIVDNSTNTYPFTRYPKSFSSGGYNVFNFMTGVLSVYGTNGFAVTQNADGSVTLDGNGFAAVVTLSSITNASGGNAAGGFVNWNTNQIALLSATYALAQASQSTNDLSGVLRSVVIATNANEVIRVTAQIGATNTALLATMAANLLAGTNTLSTWLQSYTTTAIAAEATRANAALIATNASLVLQMSAATNSAVQSANATAAIYTNAVATVLNQAIIASNAASVTQIGTATNSAVISANAYSKQATNDAVSALRATIIATNTANITQTSTATNAAVQSANAYTLQATNDTATVYGARIIATNTANQAQLSTATNSSAATASALALKMTNDLSGVFGARLIATNTQRLIDQTVVSNTLAISNSATLIYGQYVQSLIGKYTNWLVLSGAGSAGANGTNIFGVSSWTNNYNAAYVTNILGTNWDILSGVYLYGAPYPTGPWFVQAGSAPAPSAQFTTNGIIAGSNVTFSQNGGAITISSTGGSGSTTTYYISTQVSTLPVATRPAICYTLKLGQFVKTNSTTDNNGWYQTIADHP